MDLSEFLNQPIDPKFHKYEGDIKAAIVDEIEANRAVLGPRVLVGRDLQGGNPIFQPSPLTLTHRDIEDLVDHFVTAQIGQLLEFNHIYQMSTEPGGVYTDLTSES